jgi:putative ABC transport system substrate-binding protein
MRRREFIALLGRVAGAWPIVARAQTGEMRRIGVLMHVTENDPDGQARLTAFVRRLQELGWAEGRNLRLDIRWGPDDPNRYPRQAAELVATAPDVLVAPTSFTAAGMIGALINPERASAADDQLRALRRAADALGQDIRVFRAESESEIEAAFAQLAEQRAKALFVTTDAFFFSQRNRLIGLANDHAIPAIFDRREFVEAGGLMSYGGSATDIYRLAGGYIGRILKGEKPADLPVQLSTKVELMLNLKTAKALGITVPVTLLASADEVIE